MKGVLLGPQQLKQSLGAAVTALDVEGPIALVTAGWQEREDQDEDLPALFGRKLINLRGLESLRLRSTQPSAGGSPANA